MIKQYIIHAFTKEVFHGNPAAVCLLDQWLDEETMLRLTQENKLSETAFLVKKTDEENAYHLRWFTPEGEIDLCGHATLASGYVVLNYVDPDAETVYFDTMSGRLTVTKVDDRYEMDFPAYTLRPVSVTQDMAIATGAFPKKAFKGRDLVLVYGDEELVRTMTPDFGELAKLDGLLVHVTAPGKDFDCVSRSFGPKLKIEEDPVCGSGHCHIVPYWSKMKEKDDIVAYQASERGGILYCCMDGERIKISGNAVVFATSEINL